VRGTKPADAAVPQPANVTDKLSCCH
jgi:hypothetical protein